jgi:hypothetical protein
MDASRFEMLRRSLSTSPSRRAVGHGLTGMILGGLLGAPRERQSAVAKKKRKKKKGNSISCPVCPVAATCPGACSSTCGFCLTRVGAPPVCGDNATKTCLTACSSDSDCVGTDDPYCISHVFRFGTGQTGDLCPTPGGFCTNVLEPC